MKVTLSFPEIIKKFMKEKHKRGRAAALDFLGKAMGGESNFLRERLKQAAAVRKPR